MAPILVRKAGRAAVGAAVDVGVLVVYCLLLSSQEAAPNTGRVAFVAAYLAVLAALCLGATVLNRYENLFTALLGSAAAGNIGLGVVAIASIGFPLLLVGLVLLAPAAGWATRLQLRTVLPPALALLVLAAGLVATA